MGCASQVEITSTDVTGMSMLVSSNASRPMCRRRAGGWTKQFWHNQPHESLLEILINSVSSICLIMHAMGAMASHL